MTELEMFEKSFERPREFLNLSQHNQRCIDEELGILNWKGEDCTSEMLLRFAEHYTYE